MRKTYEELVSTCQKALMKYGMKEESAKEAAENIAQSTADGIYSHGILRFPRVIDYTKRGLIQVEEEITLVDAFGAIERYDGHLGMGSLQGRKAMDPTKYSSEEERKHSSQGFLPSSKERKRRSIILGSKP